LRRALSSVDLSRRPRIGWLDDEAVTEAESAVAFTKSDLESVPVGPIRAETTADRLAQILFTSGSTGTPKGVMIGHANVLHFIRWASAYFGIRNTDRISQHPSLRFDVSTFDVFGALWAGAELHLVPPELNILPHKLAGFIREARLTQWFSVPSVLNLMAKFDVIRDKDFPHLQRVLFAGEVLPTPTLVHWMRRLPHASFTNLYGPTETTISSSYYTIPRCPRDERKPIPIGTACDGEELLLLDDGLQPVTTPGIEADLYIRGQGVTGGYWRDPDRTRKAFLPCGEDGNDTMYRTGDRARRDAEGLFYFVGRADRQIKSRGYRVELNEIESALHTISELREGVVVAIESSGFESVLICCAYAPQPDCTLSLREIRGRLSRLVPAYMIPARWKSYDLVPKNSNGKFDRLLIAEHFRNAERGLVESELASAIQQPTASTA
jgi:amino acid adenylation domain-containing protein